MSSEEEKGHTDKHRESTCEAGAGVVQLQDKGHQECHNQQKLGHGPADTSIQHLMSKTGRKYISAALSHPDCGSLLRQPEETNTVSQAILEHTCS